MTYQKLFNQTLRDIRMVCNATGNEALANTIIKRMFDFSDDLKTHNLIKDKDNEKSQQNKL